MVNRIFLTMVGVVGFYSCVFFSFFSTTNRDFRILTMNIGELNRDFTETDTGYVGLHTAVFVG